jgi:uncharacterized protein YoxC
VETVLQCAQVIALISLAALCIYLIVILSDVRRDLAEFIQGIKPVMENLAFITEKLRSVAQKIDDDVDLVKNSLTSLKSAANTLFVLEKRVQQQVEEPIRRVASTIGTLAGSVGVFLDRFRPRT